MTLNLRTCALIAMLTLLPGLLSCASNPPVAKAICPQPPLPTADMLQAPPPPQWASQCLREILTWPQIESKCLTILQQYSTRPTPDSASGKP